MAEKTLTLHTLTHKNRYDKQTTLESTSERKQQKGREAYTQKTK